MVAANTMLVVADLPEEGHGYLRRTWTKYKESPLD